MTTRSIQDTNRFYVVGHKSTFYSQERVTFALRLAQLSAVDLTTSWFIYELKTYLWLVITDHIIDKVAFCCIIDVETQYYQPHTLRNHVYSQATKLLWGTPKIETFCKEIQINQ